MMTIKSKEDYEKERNLRVLKTKSVLVYTMATLIILVGIFLFFRSEFNIDLNKRYPPDVYDKVYGSIIIIYGVWRIVRAKKEKPV